MNSNSKNVELFWDCASEYFGTDVERETHPMHKAFITFLEMRGEQEEAITTEQWFEEQDYDADESWNKVLDDAEAFFSVDFCEESHKEQHDELYELWKDFQENCTECCNCGENVSNKDGMDGNLVDDEFWCVDCVDDEAHRCFSCNRFVTETEYLPSKEDEEKQQLLGHDYCLECYQNVEEICDDCEGKCRSDETESCEKCSIELRIGCGNNPSDHSIFNGFCDDCREE